MPKETRPPIRTFTHLYPQIGTLRFSIPIYDLQDVEAYLDRRTAHLPVGERLDPEIQFWLQTEKLIEPEEPNRVTTYRAIVL